MLALPAVPKPEKALPIVPPADSQQDSALNPQAATLAASDPAVGAGAVRSRLQNLRAILTARKADTQQTDAVHIQPPTQQLQQDDIAELSSSAPPSMPTAAKVQDTPQAAAQAEFGAAEAASTSILPAADPGRPVLQSIRSIASRLPSFNRLHSLLADPEKLPLGPLQPSALRDDGAQPSTESAPANGLQEAPQPQESEGLQAKPGSRMWGLQDRVQGVWLGASNRVKALRALLPAYPAYVHIGSHQILLPASPAMSKALKDAQQQGLAEERQQALNMHRMSAYRSRAIAICRCAAASSLKPVTCLIWLAAFRALSVNYMQMLAHSWQPGISRGRSSSPARLGFTIAKMVCKCLPVCVKANSYVWWCCVCPSAC